jgi:hypothetical protein
MTARKVASPEQKKGYETTDKRKETVASDEWLVARRKTFSGGRE